MVASLRLVMPMYQHHQTEDDDRMTPKPFNYINCLNLIK